LVTVRHGSYTLWVVTARCGHPRRRIGGTTADTEVSIVVDTSVPTGFIGWIQQNGQLVLFFAQLLYWLVICVAAVWATLIFRKLVASRTASTDASVVSSASTGSAAASSNAAGAPTMAGSDISVDEFVE
jgi:hypothetical protein